MPWLPSMPVNAIVISENAKSTQRKYVNENDNQWLINFVRGATMQCEHKCLSHVRKCNVDQGALKIGKHGRSTNYMSWDDECKNQIDQLSYQESCQSFLEKVQRSTARVIEKVSCEACWNQELKLNVTIKDVGTKRTSTIMQVNRREVMTSSTPVRWKSAFGIRTCKW